MLDRFLFPLVEDLIRNISGTLGRTIRRAYYKRRLARCGNSLSIDTGVVIQGASQISLGDNVWIDRYAILIAGKHNHTKIRHVANPSFTGTVGSLSIGNYAHIGISAVIQSHGGVSIGDFFTCSANCTIYSLSNDPFNCRLGTMSENASDIFYVETPVAIGNNVWLGLCTNVIGGAIQDNCFVKINSVVVDNILENSIAAGNPAIRICDRFKATD